MTNLISWKERYQCEIDRNYYEYCERNKKAPVKTRQLTQAEYHLIFNVDANNLKYIEV